jgi:hypothetical protein
MGEGFPDERADAIPITVHVTKQTAHVLDCSDSGDSSSGIDKLAVG